MKSKILILVALFVTSLSFSQRNPDATYMTSFVYEAKDEFYNIIKIDSCRCKNGS